MLDDSSQKTAVAPTGTDTNQYGQTSNLSYAAAGYTPLTARLVQLLFMPLKGQTGSNQSTGTDALLVHVIIFKFLTFSFSLPLPVSIRLKFHSFNYYSCLIIITITVVLISIIFTIIFII